MSNTSSLATTASTIQLLERFSSEDLMEFIGHLFQQLHVANDVQFLSKVLTLCHDKLPHETILNLNEKASKMTRKSNYPIIKASNPFNNLPTNIVYKIGEFLSEKDCVILGYTNRQSYTETQQRSFVFNRRHENTILKLSCDQFKLLSRSTPTGLAFCCPYQLWLRQDHAYDDIDHPPSVHMNKQQKVLADMKDNPKRWSFLCDMFGSLKQLRLDQHVASYVPVEALFNKASHVDLESLQFDFDIAESGEEWESLQDRKVSDSVSKFLSNYCNYFDSVCNNELKQIRRMKSLYIDVGMEHGLSNELSEICKGLKQNFEELDVSGGFFGLDSVESLKTIFHSNLRVFSFNCKFSQLYVQNELEDMINNMDHLNINRASKDAKDEIEFDCKLDELSIVFNPNEMYNRESFRDLTRILAFSKAAQTVHTFRLQLDTLSNAKDDEACLQLRRLLFEQMRGNLKLWEVSFFGFHISDNSISTSLTTFLKLLIEWKSLFKNGNIDCIVIKWEVFGIHAKDNIKEESRTSCVDVPSEWKDFQIEKHSFDWKVFDGAFNVEVKSDLSKESIVEIYKAIVDKSWITRLKEGAYTLQLDLQSRQ